MIKTKERIDTIGLIIPKFEDMFHTYYVSQILSGILQAANEAGFDILIHPTSKALAPKTFSTHLANILFCSGVIFADIQGNEEMLKTVITGGIPCMVINYFDKNLAAGCIAVDNEGGARKAVDYIISLGHQRIAALTGDLGIQAGRDRLEGYRKSLKNHGLGIDAKLIKECDFSPKSARSAVLELIGLDSPPTAIFAASDEMALEALRTLEKNRFKVPQDVSLVGFDDSWFAGQGPVGLTTVRQPLHRMGELAVGEIKKIITSAKKPALPKLVLETELVKRDSCVPPLTKENFY